MTILSISNSCEKGPTSDLPNSIKFHFHDVFVFGSCLRVYITIDSAEKSLSPTIRKKFFAHRCRITNDRNLVNHFLMSRIFRDRGFFSRITISLGLEQRAKLISHSSTKYSAERDE